MHNDVFWCIFQMVKVFDPGLGLGVQFEAWTSLKLFLGLSCLGSVTCPQLLLHSIFLDLKKQT